MSAPPPAAPLQFFFSYLLDSLWIGLYEYYGYPKPGLHPSPKVRFFNIFFLAEGITVKTPFAKCRFFQYIFFGEGSSKVCTHFFFFPITRSLKK
eukprot:SAG11_NODE_1943_length_4020_cov_8.087733_5_plen_94_part_00